MTRGRQSRMSLRRCQSRPRQVQRIELQPLSPRNHRLALSTHVVAIRVLVQFWASLVARNVMVYVRFAGYGVELISLSAGGFAGGSTVLGIILGCGGRFGG